MVLVVCRDGSFDCDHYIMKRCGLYTQLCACFDSIDSLELNDYSCHDVCTILYHQKVSQPHDLERLVKLAHFIDFDITCIVTDFLKQKTFDLMESK
jgi:hypothetical protein